MLSEGISLSSAFAVLRAENFLRAGNVPVTGYRLARRETEGWEALVSGSPLAKAFPVTQDTRESGLSRTDLYPVPIVKGPGSSKRRAPMGQRLRAVGAK